MGNTQDLQESWDISETGFRNHPIVPELTSAHILENLRVVQRRNGIKPSENLSGSGINLSIEMETGTGKTYTYVKTMYELNKRFGWSKFIIVVPSVAIREGVYKSLQTTQDHFAEEYGKKIRFFIYSSARLTEVDRFASDSAINVMIINMQAFNSSKNQNIIDKKLDAFRSRRPIDIIAKTNPILIIDEPQSVEGKQTKDSLKKFNALFTLRYSATLKEKYDIVYRLDAMDAYNQHLVKKDVYKRQFQKDAALAIISKLERYNGCILADSVGLGKTFTALAVIKYYENRNLRVLVLCPKKLSDNWVTYRSNYRNNPILEDRLRYDVLYHTDLSRTRGFSNGQDLNRVKWDIYDLIVIDESHNFRNGGAVDDDGKENRYVRLMNQAIRPGARTRVLMLSATPVNNRFYDLRNQLCLLYTSSAWARRLRSTAPASKTAQAAGSPAWKSRAPAGICAFPSR